MISRSDSAKGVSCPPNAAIRPSPSAPAPFSTQHSPVPKSPFPFVPLTPHAKSAKSAKIRKHAMKTLALLLPLLVLAAGCASPKISDSPERHLIVLVKPDMDWKGLPASSIGKIKNAIEECQQSIWGGRDHNPLEICSFQQDPLNMQRFQLWCNREPGVEYPSPIWGISLYRTDLPEEQWKVVSITGPYYVQYSTKSEPPTEPATP